MIFESSVCRGIPNLAAAPEGPEILPWIRPVRLQSFLFRAQQVMLRKEVMDLSGSNRASNRASTTLHQQKMFRHRTKSLRAQLHSAIRECYLANRMLEKDLMFAFLSS